MGRVHEWNAKIAATPFGRYFRLEGSGHVSPPASHLHPPLPPAGRSNTQQRNERQNAFFFTEVRAGLATFFAMAYIIAVNSTVVSNTGGTCVCPPDSPDLCDSNNEYMQCVAEVRRDLVTATAAISALTSFCMGLFANMPIGLAPGMGLNAYFTYSKTDPFKTAWHVGQR